MMAGNRRKNIGDRNSEYGRPLLRWEAIWRLASLNCKFTRNLSYFGHNGAETKNKQRVEAGREEEPRRKIRV